MNNYKLIAIDLDGTLLNEEKIITDKNREAIKKCLDNDIKVIISSGRSVEDIKTFVDDLGIQKTYCSAYHGSTIFNCDDLTVVNETFMDKSLAINILKDIVKYENVGVLVFGQKTVFSNKVNEYVLEYLKYKKFKVNEIESLLDIDEDISKILVQGKRSNLENIKLDFAHLNDTCRVLFSELDLLEFMSMDTNKGFSLEKIARMYNIDLKDTIAIGDNYNDMEMIEKAGIGVAVYNAVEELKQKADYVTKVNNNQDAISEVINKFFEF